MPQYIITPNFTWRIPLSGRPRAALMALGVHGPAASERHCVARYWCVHLYTYEGAVVVDGRESPIYPGAVGILAPGAETVYSFPRKSVHACAHFSFPEDAEASDLVDIPVMQDAGPRFGDLYRAMEEAIAVFPSSRLQAEVRLWDILWQLARPSRFADLATNKTHPAVRRAMEMIELRLREPLCVADLAEEVELSHNQLTRLFRDATGDTVIGYIQRRRVERAAHLLRNSQLPIKTIAAQVGVSDPRQFNKLMHKSLGGSPLEIRRGGA